MLAVPPAETQACGTPPVTVPTHTHWGHTRSRVRLDTPQSTYSPLLRLQPSSPQGPSRHPAPPAAHSSRGTLHTPKDAQTPPQAPNAPSPHCQARLSPVRARCPRCPAGCAAPPAGLVLLTGWGTAHTLQGRSTAACLHGLPAHSKP